MNSPSSPLRALLPSGENYEQPWVRPTDGKGWARASRSLLRERRARARGCGQDTRATSPEPAWTGLTATHALPVSPTHSSYYARPHGKGSESSWPWQIDSPFQLYR
jgi:hypothetical protein